MIGMINLKWAVLAVSLCAFGDATAHAQTAFAPKPFVPTPQVRTPFVPTPFVPTPQVRTPFVPTPNLGLVNGEYKLGIYADYTRFGVVVRAVEPGSAAQRLGIESGDVIRSINGITITGYSSYVQAMNNGGGYVDMWVRNVRDGGTVRVRGSVYSLLPVPPGPIFGAPAGRP
jgi:membrane-associated protease RseP (regulator of RpoE activity)